MAIEENANDPRQAAEEARNDLQALGPRINRFTVTDLHTGVETLVHFDGPSRAGSTRSTGGRGRRASEWASASETVRRSVPGRHDNGRQ
ncbi:hypothetical protein [Actinomadura hibisca]|uniref:hypothetical protein n=1 Tax=Actinomadura hibisca TaxID=68565 RepID=UPI0012F7873F|nr:hypothetical protein [Actinomadura hibisca]